MWRTSRIQYIEIPNAGRSGFGTDHPHTITHFSDNMADFLLSIGESADALEKKLSLFESLQCVISLYLSATQSSEHTRETIEGLLKTSTTGELSLPAPLVGFTLAAPLVRELSMREG